MVENGAFVPKDASVAKKVWFGVGKFVESQSPKAWEKRILTIIDEKIIPKLSPENQKWLAEIRPKVEKAAKVGGVVVTVAEITAAVGVTVVLGKKVGKFLEKRAMSKEPKAFTEWVGRISNLHKEKYAPDSKESARFANALRTMGRQVGSAEMTPEKHRWENLLVTAAANDRPSQSDKAVDFLRRIFTKAYGPDADGVGTQMATRAFEEYRDLQFPGLPDLLYAGQRNGEAKLPILEAVMPKFWQASRGFTDVPHVPAFSDVLRNLQNTSEYVFEDKKYPGGGIPAKIVVARGDPYMAQYAESLLAIPPGKTSNIKEHLSVKPEVSTLTELAHSTALPKPTLGERVRDKFLMREHVGKTKQRVERENRIRKRPQWERERQSLLAKQMDQSRSITYQDMLAKKTQQEAVQSERRALREANAAAEKAFRDGPKVRAREKLASNRAILEAQAKQVPIDAEKLKQQGYDDARERLWAKQRSTEGQITYKDRLNELAENDRAKKADIENMVSSVFRSEQTDRRAWVAHRLQIAKDMAEKDVGMKALLGSLAGIQGTTALEQREEARVLTQVLERVQAQLPKSEKGIPNDVTMFTLASNLVMQFHKNDVPLAVIKEQGGGVGNVLIEQLLRENTQEVYDLVRKVANAGTNYAEKERKYEPTQALVDLFAHAYKTITRIPQGNQTDAVAATIGHKIAKQFIQHDRESIGKLYERYPLKS